MSNDWDFYFCQVEGRPASIFLDLGIAAEAPVASHPHLGYVSVEMRMPRRDGLSSQEEFETLSAIDDALPAGVADNGNAFYVGRKTSDGSRDYFFFAADPGAFAADVERTMALFPAYRFDSGSQPDPGWSTYFDFLSPSDDDRQRILNRRVQLQLAEHGDDQSQPRPIDHRLYFPDAGAAAAFTARLTGQGFDIAPPVAMDEGDVAVDLKRSDRPGDMDEVVLALLAEARPSGGSYDGWGCTIVPARG
jgi:uncharacterized protein DUF695/regulator of ribonuclease activity B